MKLHRGEIISLLIIVASIITGVLVYPALPEQIASHWDTQGQVNGSISKFWGVALMPIILAGMWLLFVIIPHIDPKKENIEKFRSSYDNFIVVITAFIFYGYLLILAWNLGYQFDFVRFLVPALAVLFYDVGSLVGTAHSNWMIGIRTPWTLSSQTVWDKTHALGEKLFKASALIMLIALFFPAYALWLILLPVLGTVLVSVVYSYVEYQKINH